MKLLIKQRVFSWSDTYDVYDENGNPCVAPDAKWDATAQYDKEEGEE